MVMVYSDGYITPMFIVCKLYKWLLSQAVYLCNINLFFFNHLQSQVKYEPQSIQETHLALLDNAEAHQPPKKIAFQWCKNMVQFQEYVHFILGIFTVIYNHLNVRLYIFWDYSYFYRLQLMATDYNVR